MNTRKNGRIAKIVAHRPFLLKSVLSLKTEVQKMGMARKLNAINVGLHPKLHAINRDPKKIHHGEI